MNAMEQHILTPYEVREAAMFAATNFIMIHGSDLNWDKKLGYEVTIEQEEI